MLIPLLSSSSLHYALVKFGNSSLGTAPSSVLVVRSIGNQNANRELSSPVQGMSLIEYVVSISRKMIT